MILSPWPMIFRSLPMTDFSPLEVALKCDCAPFAPLGRPVRRSIVLGSSVGLRWNMESPRGVVDRTTVKVAANTWWNYVVTSIWPVVTHFQVCQPWVLLRQPIEGPQGFGSDQGAEAK